MYPAKAEQNGTLLSYFNYQVLCCDRLYQQGEEPGVAPGKANPQPK